MIAFEVALHIYPSMTKETLIRRNKMSKAKTTLETLKNHPMWHQNDYDYFTGKGYDHDEILAFWERDHKKGCSPCTWEEEPTDIVAVINGLQK